MKLERNYLLSEEIRHILNSLDGIDDEFSKEILKKAFVGQMLIKDVNWEEYETCNDVYDAIIADGIDLEVEVKNFYVIDDILCKENSLEKVVEKFLNGIESKIEEYGKSIDAESLKGLIGELKELQIENDEVKMKKE